ncbi:MAG: FecR domain-containing protein [Deltaproteobacteria bacterium]|nr:FecR domain-containing protein [Deltaproteobacteria bacterium]
MLRFRLLIAAVLCSVVVGSAPTAARADSEIVALAVEGRVTIVRPGVGDVALAPGIVIEPGDHLVSDDEGRALVRWADNALVTIGPYTQVLFDRVSGGGSIGDIAILSGDARVLVRPNEAAIPARIATKSAKIVTGDGYFAVRHERNEERTQILGLAGSIDVSRPEDDRVKYTVSPGQWCAVDRASGVAIPQSANPEFTESLKSNTAIRYFPPAESLPGQVKNLGDSPLRDIPTKLTGTIGGTGVETSTLAEFEPFPSNDGRSPDIPEGLEIDRESDVSLVIIFNDLIEKNRPLVKK